MSKAPFRLELCAWCASIVCASVLLFHHVEARGAQKAASRFNSVHVSESGTASAAALSETRQSKNLASADGVIGRLDVPDLHLSVPILDDYDPSSLRRGVGRMGGTARLGGLGNLVLAGHRDTYFRPLRHVHQGLSMRVVTASATYVYIVDSTSIVSPEEVSVLDIGDRPEMTLITCYPFDFIGAAPKRFIVHTHLLSADGESR